MACWSLTLWLLRRKNARGDPPQRSLQVLPPLHRSPRRPGVKYVTAAATPLSLHLVFSRTLSVPITKLKKHHWLARSALDILGEIKMVRSFPPPVIVIADLKFIADLELGEQISQNQARSACLKGGTTAFRDPDNPTSRRFHNQRNEAKVSALLLGLSDRAPKTRSAQSPASS